jgi:hypothetical protein
MLRASERRFVGFEVLAAVVMKSTDSWDITPYIPLKVNRRFRGGYLFYLQGRRISQARNQLESRCQAEQSPCKNFGLYKKQEVSNNCDKVSPIYRYYLPA